MFYWGVKSFKKNVVTPSLAPPVCAYPLVFPFISDHFSETEVSEHFK